MTTPPVLSYVIPVRNDADRLSRCLSSIQAGLESIAAERIVADNGSTDHSAEVARAAGATVLSLPGYGVAELRNRAAKVARGEFLAFVDADHELAVGWAVAAVRILQDPSVAATGALCHAPENGTWVQHMYDRLRRHRPGVHRVDWLGSGNLVIRRAVFESLGGFDVTLETCEDVDLCQRLREAGGQIVADDALWNVHYGDPVSLRALFFGELWRGRDNLRVSMRVPLTMRSLPGIAIPVVNLVGLVLLALGLAVAPFGGGLLLALGAAVVAVLAAARAAGLLLASSSARSSLATPVQAFVFAVVFHAARSLALVSRVSHAARRTT